MRGSPSTDNLAKIISEKRLLELELSKTKQNLTEVLDEVLFTEHELDVQLKLNTTLRDSTSEFESIFKEICFALSILSQYSAVLEEKVIIPSLEATNKNLPKDVTESITKMKTEAANDLQATADKLTQLLGSANELTAAASAITKNGFDAAEVNATSVDPELAKVISETMKVERESIAELIATLSDALKESVRRCTSILDARTASALLSKIISETNRKKVDGDTDEHELGQYHVTPVNGDSETREHADELDSALKQLEAANTKIKVLTVREKTLATALEQAERKLKTHASELSKSNSASPQHKDANETVDPLHAATSQLQLKYDKLQQDYRQMQSQMEMIVNENLQLDKANRDLQELVSNEQLAALLHNNVRQAAANEYERSPSASDAQQSEVQKLKHHYEDEIQELCRTFQMESEKMQAEFNERFEQLRVEKNAEMEALKMRCQTDEEKSQYELNASRESLTEITQHHEDEKQLWKDMIKQYERDNDQWKEKCRLLEERVQALIQEHTQKMESLNSAIKFSHEPNIYAAELSRLTSELESEKRRTSALEKELELATAAYKSVDEENQQLNSHNASLESEISEIAQTVSNMSRTLQNDTISAQELAETKKQLNRSQTEIEQLNNSFCKLQRELEDANQNIAEKDTAIISLQEHLDVALQELSQPNTSADTSNVRSSKEFIELQQKVVTLHMSLHESRTEKRNLENRYTQLHHENVKLMDQIETLQEKLAESKASILRLESECVLHEEHATALNARLKNFESAKIQVETELAEVESRLEMLELDNLNVTEEPAEHQSHLANLLDSKVRLLKSVFEDQISQQRDRYEASIRVLQSEISKLASDTSELKEYRLNDSSTLRQNNIEELEQLRRHVAEHGSVVDEVHRDINDIKEGIVMMQQSVILICKTLEAYDQQVNPNRVSPDAMKRIAGSRRVSTNESNPIFSDDRRRVLAAHVSRILQKLQEVMQGIDGTGKLLQTKLQLRLATEYNKKLSSMVNEKQHQLEEAKNIIDTLRNELNECQERVSTLVLERNAAEVALARYNQQVKNSTIDLSLKRF